MVTRCIWEGRATYRTIVVDGRENHDAACNYERPTILARKIRGQLVDRARTLDPADDICHILRPAVPT